MKASTLQVLLAVRVLTRRTPILYGYFDRVIRLLLPLLPADDECVTVSYRHGTRICLNLADDDGRQVFFFDANDLRLLRLLECLLVRGDSFVDVGANCGSLSMAAAGRVGATGYVLSFEPNPRLAASIEASIAASNAGAWMRLENCGLGDREAELLLSYPAGYSGHGTLVRQPSAPAIGGKPLVTQSVRVRPLDSFLTPAMPHGGVMKLDVEGFEDAVFRGGMNWIREVEPRVIIFECKTTGPLCDVPAAQLLGDAGYEFFALSRHLFRPSIVKINPELAPTTQGDDMVAVRRSQLSCVASLLRKR